MRRLTIPILTVVFTGFMLVSDGFSASKAQTGPGTLGKYRTACGPIACYTTLRYLELPADFEELCDKTGWEEDGYVTLGQIDQALCTVPTVKSHPVKLDAEALLHELSQDGTAAILAVKKGGEKIDHVVTAAYVNSSKILIIDSSRGPRTIDLNNLNSIWDGHTILVRKVMPVQQNLRMVFVLNAMFWILAGLIVSVMLFKVCIAIMQRNFMA